ncbi:MAG: hypothetical protein WHX52_12965 [Anaerolineae bacterium]
MNKSRASCNKLSQETRETVPPNVVGWTLKPPGLEQLARDLHKALA